LTGTRTIVLAGPTASGKSSLALALAARLEGDVICGDSRQVYARMQIGAAGPTDDERAAAPHRGYGEVEPAARFDAARFIEATDAHIRAAHEAGRAAIVVGGAGMYLRALRFGLEDVPPRDDDVRARLEAEPIEALYARLQSEDPESAAAIQSKDPVRLVRALEILELTGEKPSELRRSHFNRPPRLEASWLLLWPEREWLYARINARAAAMFDEGLIEEALALRAHLGPRHALLETMGYREALALRDGSLSRDEAIAETRKRHRNYAKRQLTWFKKETWWSRLEIPPLPTAEGIEALLPGV
jgi:tRNA dimethylallyltransferase